MLTNAYALYAAQDFPELLAIRAQLAAKYGKEFITEASSDISCLKWNVNENMIRRGPASAVGVIRGPAVLLKCNVPATSSEQS